MIRKEGAYYKIQFRKLQYKDDADITNAINRCYEEWIRQNPAQWFWVHDRWDIAKKSSSEA